MDEFFKNNPSVVCARLPNRSEKSKWDLQENLESSSLLDHTVQGFAKEAFHSSIVSQTAADCSDEDWPSHHVEEVQIDPNIAECISKQCLLMAQMASSIFKFLAEISCQVESLTEILTKAKPNKFKETAQHEASTDNSRGDQEKSDVIRTLGITQGMY